MECGYCSLSPLGYIYVKDVAITHAKPGSDKETLTSFCLSVMIDLKSVKTCIYDAAAIIIRDVEAVDFHAASTASASASASYSSSNTSSYPNHQNGSGQSLPHPYKKS